MDEDIDIVRTALAKLASELSARSGDVLTVQVSEPSAPLQIKDIAALINQYGSDVGAFLDREAQRQKLRADELMQAYNALQSQTEEMNKELSMARRIQQRLLPQENELPNRPEICAWGFYRSMSNVGGDLYDIVRMGRNQYGILIADVSGHGIPAALITALIKISFRTKVRFGVSSNEVCRQVNEELYPILGDISYYATAFFGIVDLECATFRYTNCGHHPCILLREEGEQVMEELDTKGRFLGAFDDAVYEEKTVRLDPGDVLFLYTDGITESRNLLDEEYTDERMFSLLKKMGALEPKELIEKIRRDVDSFCMGSEPRDDQSMFAVGFIGAADDLTVPESMFGQEAQNQPSTTADAKNDTQPLRDTTSVTVRFLAETATEALRQKQHQKAAACIRALEELGFAPAAWSFRLAELYARSHHYGPAKHAAERASATNSALAKPDEVLASRIETFLAHIKAAEE